MVLSRRSALRRASTTTALATPQRVSEHLLLLLSSLPLCVSACNMPAASVVHGPTCSALPPSLLTPAAACRCQPLHARVLCQEGQPQAVSEVCVAPVLSLGPPCNTCTQELALQGLITVCCIPFVQHRACCLAAPFRVPPAGARWAGRLRTMRQRRSPSWTATSGQALAWCLLPGPRRTAPGTSQTPRPWKTPLRR